VETGRISANANKTGEPYGKEEKSGQRSETKASARGKTMVTGERINTPVREWGEERARKVTQGLKRWGIQTSKAISAGKSAKKGEEGELLFKTADDEGIKL